MVTVLETESCGSGGFVPPNFPLTAGNDGGDPDKNGNFIVIFTDRRRTQRHM